MALSEKRIGEIAMISLQAKLEKDGGLKLMPSEVKREVKISAKNLNIPTTEVAEFFKLLLENGYIKTITEIEKMIEGKVEWLNSLIKG